MNDTVTIMPHETNELLPLEVTVDGVETITGVKYAIVPDTERPVTWASAVVVGSNIAARINGLTAGRYRIWTQTTANSEIAIIDNGVLFLT